jgi:hypothetical protein
MNCENCRLATTMDGATLGNVAEELARAARASEAPPERSAATRAPPAHTRAYTTIPPREAEVMLRNSPDALMVRASRMNGKESCTSARRMSAADGQRSTNPAMSPSPPPTTAVASTVHTPMKRERRAP